MRHSKIVIAINDLAYGGGQRTVVEEANQLSKEGIEVYVLTTLKGAKSDLLPLLRISEGHFMHIPFRSITDLPAYIKLLRYLRKIGSREIISNLFFTNTIIRVSKLFLPRLQITVREGNVPFEKSVRVTIIDFILSLLTHRTIFNSDFVRHSLRIQSFFSKTSVLYNGISMKFLKDYPSQRDRFRSEYAISNNELIILTVGSLVPKKGQDLLIKAFARLQAPNVHLFIVGVGHRRQHLETLAEALQVSDRVRFLGGRNDMESIYAASDIFVLPSLWEGMPNALLEALASNLPTIATDVGGVTEVLKDGQNGLIVAPGDIDGLVASLNTLVRDDSQRRTYGRAARESVKNLSWPDHTKKLLSMI